MRSLRWPWLLGFLCISACSTADHTASYMINDEAKLKVQLKAIHPYLAEYERTVVLVRKGKPIVRKIMMLDSGGYSAGNLYDCGSGVFMLKGYFDTWRIDGVAGKIWEGDCDDPVYLGVFEGGGSVPWQFHGADLRQEVDLVPSGG